jgi:hypothetical protein
MIGPESGVRSEPNREPANAKLKDGACENTLGTKKWFSIDYSTLSWYEEVVAVGVVTILVENKKGAWWVMHSPQHQPAFAQRVPIRR